MPTRIPAGSRIFSENRAVKRDGALACELTAGFPFISAVHTSLHDSSTGVCGVLPVPREETSAVPLKGGLRVAEELPMPAGTGVSHSGTALPQHLCVGSRGLVVEKNRRGLVTLDQHPLVRQPGRGRVVEERRHHRVVEQLEGNTSESVLEAAQRSCRGCDSHGIRW